MRIPTITLDSVTLDAARRRLLTRLAGLFTGSAVALTLVQFSAARRERDRQD